VARGSLTSLHPPSLSTAGAAEIGAAQDAAPHASAEVLSSTSDAGETPLEVSVWRATLQDRGGQVGGERSSEKAFAPPFTRKSRFWLHCDRSKRRDRELSAVDKDATKTGRCTRVAAFCIRWLSRIQVREMSAKSCRGSPVLFPFLFRPCNRRRRLSSNPQSATLCGAITAAIRSCTDPAFRGEFEARRSTTSMTRSRRRQRQRQTGREQPLNRPGGHRPLARGTERGLLCRRFELRDLEAQPVG
jgi:hypothetical protein